MKVKSKGALDGLSASGKCVHVESIVRFARLGQTGMTINATSILR
jgi:hypothetical protein